MKSTETKPFTVEQLVNEIYEDNFSHLEFEWNMGGEPCECKIHQTMETIVKYREQRSDTMEKTKAVEGENR